MGGLMDVFRELSSNLRTGDLSFLVVVDEDQHLFDVSRECSKFDANRVVEAWFTGSRFAGIGRVAGAQEPSSLPRFVSGNTHLLVSFRVLGEELKVAGTALFLSYQQQGVILRFVPFGECVFRHPLFHFPFRVFVGRSRYAAEKNLKSVYNSHRCPIPGTTKLKGSIP